MKPTTVSSTTRMKNGCWGYQAWSEAQMTPGTRAASHLILRWRFTREPEKRRKKISSLIAAEAPTVMG